MFSFEKSSVGKYNKLVHLGYCGRCPNFLCDRNVRVFGSLQQLVK